MPIHVPDWNSKLDKAFDRLRREQFRDIESQIKYTLKRLRDVYAPRKPRKNKGAK